MPTLRAYLARVTDDPGVCMVRHTEATSRTARTFRAVVFTGSDFTNVVMPKADFRGALIRGADFDGAKMPGCSFRGATIMGSSFGDSDLTGCDFSEVRWVRANSSSNSSTNLSGAKYEHPFGIVR